jgi:hypothetical protein
MFDNVDAIVPAVSGIIFDRIGQAHHADRSATAPADQERATLHRPTNYGHLAIFSTP